METSTLSTACPTIVLFTLFIGTNAQAMSNTPPIAQDTPRPPNSTAMTVCKQASDTKQEEEKTPSRHQSLNQILYNLLETTPPELLPIMIDYESYELTKCAAQIPTQLPPICMTTLSGGQLAYASVIDKQIHCLNLTNQQGKALEPATKRWDLRQLTYLGNDQFAYQAGHKVEILTVTDSTLTSIQTKKNCRPYCISNAQAGLFATGSHRSIALWDIKDGSRHAEAPLNGKQYPSCLYLLPHQQIIVGNYSGCIQWLNLTGKPQYTNFPDSHSKKISCFAPLSSTRIASGSEDSTIKIWDLQTKHCIQTLIGHKGKITSLIALNDNQIASGSDDGTVIIWTLDTDDHHPLTGQLLNLQAPVTSLCRLPNGYLAIGIRTEATGPHNSRGEIQIWY